LIFPFIFPSALRTISCDLPNKELLPKRAMFQEPHAGWNKTIDISIHTSIHTSYDLDRPAQEEVTSQKGNIPRPTRRLEQNDRDFHSYFHPYFVRSTAACPTRTHVPKGQYSKDHAPAGTKR